MTRNPPPAESWTPVEQRLPELGEVVRGIHVAPNGYRTILGDVRLVRAPTGGFWFYAHSQARVPADRLPTHWRGHEK